MVALVAPVSRAEIRAPVELRRGSEEVFIGASFFDRSGVVPDWVGREEYDGSSNEVFSDEDPLLISGGSFDFTNGLGGLRSEAYELPEGGGCFELAEVVETSRGGRSDLLSVVRVVPGDMFILSIRGFGDNSPGSLLNAPLLEECLPS